MKFTEHEHVGSVTHLHVTLLGPVLFENTRSICKRYANVLRKLR